MSARSGLVGNKSSWPHFMPFQTMFSMSPKQMQNAYFPGWANGAYSPIKIDQTNPQKTSNNNKNHEISQNPKWAKFSAEIRSGPKIRATDFVNNRIHVATAKSFWIPRTVRLHNMPTNVVRTGA